MTGTWSSRRFQAALALIAVGAFALRAFPFLGPDGAWSYRVDYDEGVYFSAASYLLQGVLPYRDFVFVHPPGIVLFLAFTSAWTHSFLGVAEAFAVSRWVAAAMGGLNVLWVGCLVVRGAQGEPHSARWGGLFAAAFYATYAEVVAVERGPFLEPLLNCVCLAMAAAVVEASRREGRRSERWLVAAGALAGVALSIKVWAVLWVLGAAWGASAFASRRGMLLFLGVTALACAGVVLPFALAAPQAFFTEVGLFHLWRPPDGTTDRLERLGQIVALRHLGSPLLALVMLALLWLRRGPGWTVTLRLFGTAYLLTLAAFLASPAWWNQYNAHLIASEAVLAGALLAWGAAQIPAGTRGAQLARWLGLPFLLASLAVSVSHSIRRSRSGGGEHLSVRRSPLPSAEGCVFSFEPGWLLASGRLPPRLAGAPLVVDTYAHQLLDAGAASGTDRFQSAGAAFEANRTPLMVLEQCDFVVLGERGRRQLSAKLLERLGSTHAPIQAPHEPLPETWERRGRP